MLTSVLDEIDYGMIVVDPYGRVCHANHVGHAELARNEHLCLTGEYLDVRSEEHRESFTEAVSQASQGVRCMVDLSHPGSSLAPMTIALVPVGGKPKATARRSAVLVITGRQQICAQISLQFFAKRYGLSRSEQAVLQALVQGSSIQDVAVERSLAISTVRSQVKDIRFKTRCKSMRELLRKVSALPPLVSLLKNETVAA